MSNMDYGITNTMITVTLMTTMSMAKTVMTTMTMMTMTMMMIAITVMTMATTTMTKVFFHKYAVPVCSPRSSVGVVGSASAVVARQQKAKIM